MNVTGKCEIRDDNKCRKRRKMKGKRNHATVVASNKTIIDRDCDASDSGRSDNTALEDLMLKIEFLNSSLLMSQQK